MPYGRFQLFYGCYLTMAYGTIDRLIQNQPINVCSFTSLSSPVATHPAYLPTEHAEGKYLSKSPVYQPVAVL